MSKKTASRGALLIAACALFARPALAVDPYESIQYGAPVGDNDNQTNTSLTPGMTQTHDLDQAGGGDDVDWMMVPTIIHHSYEARVSGNIGWDWGNCSACAQIERVSASGQILTEDVAMVNEGSGAAAESYDRSVRWMASASTVNEFLRVKGSTLFTENASSIYTVRYWDTTYAIPRWNASGGQTTVFLISNMVQATVTGQITFWEPAGTILGIVTFFVGPNQLFVFNTSSLPALAGLSGHATVAHNAGYGGLAGKAVALEPATGFSFDTPMVPIPN
jgi:hypothetical protein